MFHTDSIDPNRMIEGPDDLRVKKAVTGDPASQTAESRGEISEIDGLVAALRATARPAIVEDPAFRRYIPDLADK
ncbi:MAG: hypothetical protein AAB551_00595 [Patescibacteria group bacterium]